MIFSPPVLIETSLHLPRGWRFTGLVRIVPTWLTKWSPRLSPEMNTLTWSYAEGQFVNYLRHERTLSEETIRAYAADLRQFARYLASAEPSGLELDKITPDLIRGYLLSVHKTLEKTSRARKLSTLRSFFRYLNGCGLYAENPAELVAHPKINQKTPAFLQVDAVFHFLDTLSRSALMEGVSWRKARNWALFESLYSTGIRVSELVKLNLDNINFDEGTIRVFGKGRKERVVPIGGKAMDAVKYYLSALDFQFPKAKPRSSAVFQKCARRQTDRSFG